MSPTTINLLPDDENEGREEVQSSQYDATPVDNEVQKQDNVVPEPSVVIPQRAENLQSMEHISVMDEATPEETPAETISMNEENVRDKIEGLLSEDVGSQISSEDLSDLSSKYPEELRDVSFMIHSQDILNFQTLGEGGFFRAVKAKIKLLTNSRGERFFLIRAPLAQGGDKKLLMPYKSMRYRNRELLDNKDHDIVMKFVTPPQDNDNNDLQEQYRALYQHLDKSKKEYTKKSRELPMQMPDLVLGTAKMPIQYTIPEGESSTGIVSSSHKTLMPMVTFEKPLKEIPKLSEIRQLSLAQKAEMAEKMAESIIALHEQSTIPTIHADIKLANFLQTEEGKYVTTDTNIASKVHIPSTKAEDIRAAQDVATGEETITDNKTIERDISAFAFMYFEMMKSDSMVHNHQDYDIPAPLRKVLQRGLEGKALFTLPQEERMSIMNTVSTMSKAQKAQYLEEQGISYQTLRELVQGISEATKEAEKNLDAFQTAFKGRMKESVTYENNTDIIQVLQGDIAVISQFKEEVPEAHRIAKHFAFLESGEGVNEADPQVISDIQSGLQSILALNTNNVYGEDFTTRYQTMLQNLYFEPQEKSGAEKMHEFLQIMGNMDVFISQYDGISDVINHLNTLLEESEGEMDEIKGYLEYLNNLLGQIQFTLVNQEYSGQFNKDALVASIQEMTFANHDNEHYQKLFTMLAEKELEDIINKAEQRSRGEADAQ